jgi:hypothetical protein
VNDFNHDGNADVVLADGSVYLGNGDGTLRFLASASLGAVAVATGDFNHDGNPDLAAAAECAPAGCSSGGQILIASGNGDGTFQTPTALPSGGFYAESLVVADFNNDGNLDIALVNNCTDSGCSAGGSVSIYLGAGNGTFSLLNTITTISGTPLSVVAGDFNNDGLIDLAVGGINSSGIGAIVNLLLGNGDGSFQTPIVFNTNFLIGGWGAAAIGDFNSDGILDLALAEATCSDCGGHGQILYGNGDGTFTAGPSIPTEGGPPQSVVAADFFGTGALTPVLANRCVDVLDCPQGSVMIAGTQNQTDIMLLYLAVGDFNNDGKPDVVGSLQYDTGASVLLNVGATATATTTTISPSAPQSYSAFQPVTFTAKLQHTGPGTPTGTVAFLDSGVLIGSGAVDSNGQASLTTTGLAVGSHFVVAYYRGDSSFATSNSLGAHVTINKANTSTTLTSSQNPSQYGQAVTFTATVAPQYGGTPTGTASFFDGTTNLGNSPVNGSGVATLTTSTLAIGTHSMTAVYNGDTNFVPSTSPVLYQVVRGVIDVTFSPTSLTFSNQVVFTTSPAQQVTLTNSGSGVLKITRISVTVPFHQTNNCPSSVAPGANCTISVTFHPGNKGVFHGAVSVTDNAPGSPQKVPLAGTGTFVQLVPIKVNFGNQPVGTRSLPKKITLTNKGGAAVNITSISITGADAGDFAETNTCGKSVASGASCFIKITFKPLVKGKRTADVSVYDNGGGSPQKVGLVGTGT